MILLAVIKWCTAKKANDQNGEFARLPSLTQMLVITTGLTTIKSCADVVSAFAKSERSEQFGRDVTFDELYYYWIQGFFMQTLIVRYIC